MGFEIEWSQRARLQFDSLIAQPGIDKLFVLKAIAGRPHDEWLKGRRFHHPALAADDIRLLEGGAVGLVYALFESEQRVRILAILSNRPE